MTMPSRFVHAVVFVAGLLMLTQTTAMAVDAKVGVKANSYDIGSRASQFLQSKARMSVLDQDDKVVADCQDKHFVKINPFRALESHVVRKIAERKWREIWTLARCGITVDYMLIFTEVGSGGASYAILGPKTVAEMDDYESAELAAEPPSRDFLVYFDTSRFNVGGDSAETLEAVVNATKQLGDPKLVLTGHTDTMGSSAFNQRLSDERARSVKTYLVRRGISAAAITTVGKGKADQRLSTPDQARAQENRNVRIELE